MSARAWICTEEQFDAVQAGIMKATEGDDIDPVLSAALAVCVQVQAQNLHSERLDRAFGPVVPVQPERKGR